MGLPHRKPRNTAMLGSCEPGAGWGVLEEEPEG